MGSIVTSTELKEASEDALEEIVSEALIEEKDEGKEEEKEREEEEEEERGPDHQQLCVDGLGVALEPRNSSRGHSGSATWPQNEF